MNIIAVKNGVKNIQTVAYNGACMVITINRNGNISYKQANSRAYRSSQSELVIFRLGAENLNILICLF